MVADYGGFAVDHRPGKEETYFVLPGGILKMSADLRQVVLVPSAQEMCRLSVLKDSRDSVSAMRGLVEYPTSFFNNLRYPRSGGALASGLH